MTSSDVSDKSDISKNSQPKKSHTPKSWSADEEDEDSSELNPDSWDKFQTVAREEQWQEESFTLCLRCIKIVCIFFLFLVIVTTGVANKLALLTLTSAILNDGKIGTDPTPTMLLLALCFPYLCHLLIYSAKSLFGSNHWPSLPMIVVILLLETSHTTGLCLLLFRVLPRVDMMRAQVLLVTVYIMPSLLSVITITTTNCSATWRRVVTSFIGGIIFLLQVGGAGFATYQDFLYNSTEERRLEQEARSSQSNKGIARLPPTVTGQNLDVQLPLALFLISMGFWENFIDGDFRFCGKTFRMSKWKARLSLVRHRLYMLVSVFKISLSIILTAVLVPRFTFTLNFPPNTVSTALSDKSAVSPHLLMYGPLYTMLLAGSLCAYLSGLACKLCMQTFAFALPLTLVTPASAVLVMLDCEYHILTTPSSVFTWVCPDRPSQLTSWSSYHLMMLGVLWLSQSLLLGHVWRSTSGRMEKIQELFIIPMRCSVLTEQTLMARRRISYRTQYGEDLQFDGPGVGQGQTDVTSLIYACATMWHETREEMVQLLKSIFRMDIDRSARFIAQKYYNIRDPDYYDFEGHIFFDDAMELSEDGQLSLPNQFVSTFVNCVDEAISAVHERPTSLGDPVRTPTPYGGRLTWVLPGGTPLVVHLKDKNKIRLKKRWSQVMYMYYLLGYKILAISETEQDQEAEVGQVSEAYHKQETGVRLTRSRLSTPEIRCRHTAEHFTRSVIFNYVSDEVQNQADSTYILALDGDVDFKPDAVRLLVDRMKKNKKVGAACGRIHPVGSGPMVWYQMFEYAIGHWLQKAAEHVFGCVLCAPGCFSLFRGSALMDDNVARTYATRSTQARHYIQYDQGEDRWLSTLLLQQGYRIDYCAAADALTHAPETFNEFFNQRRRWGPSTLANLMDLIGDWRMSVRLNDNLSTLYIFYQSMMFVSTVLGPATIVLLLAGSFKVVFKISVVGSYALALLAPAFYHLLCLYATPRVQLKVGAALSAAYALVMTIVLVGTVGTAIEGSITSPNVLFLFTIIFVFIISGFLHPRELQCIIPGILYLILIPAGYLVLTIYFLTNLHVVSWGTRESQQRTVSQNLQSQETEEEERRRQGDEKKLGFLGGLGLHAVLNEVGNLLKQCPAFLLRKVHEKSKSADAKSRTDELLEELIVEVRKARVCVCSAEELANNDRNSQSQANRVTNDLLSCQNPNFSSADYDKIFSEKVHDTLCHAEHDALIKCSSNHTHETYNVSEASKSNSKERSEEFQLTPYPDDVLDQSWLLSDLCGQGPVTKLNQREWAFWRQLISKYLYPLSEDNANLKEINSDLKSLRNNVVFGFVMISAVWVALTMQLEVLQNELQSYLFVHIPHFSKGPQLKFQPLGMFFLATFAFILITQFLGMLAHRWGTFLHTLAITHLGLGRTSNEQKKVRDTILRVIELQKLRNIELEPDPDYEEPLPDYGVSVVNPVYAPDHHEIVQDFSELGENIRQGVHDAFKQSVNRTELNTPATSQRHLYLGPRPFRMTQEVEIHDSRFDPWAKDWHSRPSGPVSGSTLQRAFEKRYRNRIALNPNSFRSSDTLSKFSLAMGGERFEPGVISHL